MAQDQVPRAKEFFLRSEAVGKAIVRPFEEFTREEATGGILLVIAAVAALALANSSLGPLYDKILHLDVGLAIGSRAITQSIHFCINEILMTVFFLVVGLEVKRELLVGELASVRKAALPALAALGGLVVPAGIYYALNAGTPEGVGWGVPMATDIAFVLGALALLGNRVPSGLALFLVALAIVDDIGAVIVIAVFYSSSISFTFLMLAGLGMVGLIALNLLGFRSVIPFLMLAVVVWIGTYLSGIHATVSGILVAITIPCRSKIDKYAFKERAQELVDQFQVRGERGFIWYLSEANQSVVDALERLCIGIEPALQRMEHRLHPWSAFAVVPLFALANAGIEVHWDTFIKMLTSRPGLGIILGLFVGKQVGIFSATWMGVKLGLVNLPEGVGFRHIYGGAVLCGIGFTMSIFVANLCFTDPAALDNAKLAVLFASVLAGVVGMAVLGRAQPPEPMTRANRERLG